MTTDLERDGFKAAVIHGNKSQNARQKALNDFRDGSVRILVATDIAARGIDVPGISHVVNFDLPDEAESYVHRIGRTGRNGVDGIAITLCDPSENCQAARRSSASSACKLPIVADHLGSPDPQRNPAEKNERFEPANDATTAMAIATAGGPAAHNTVWQASASATSRPCRRAQAGRRAQAVQGNNKRRFGGKRPAARAA